MKVEDAIVMLQTLPAGSEVDLQIRRIVTPDQAARPRRTSADRMRDLRAKKRASHPVTSVTNVTPSDESDGAERHGGTQGGSDPDQTEKSGKETGITGSHLTGQSGARGESDANGDAGDASHPVTPSPVKPKRERRTPAAPLVPMPADFALTEAHRKYTDSKGWPWWWVQDRFDRFVGLAGSKAWRYADWNLAFYTHLRGEIGYQRGPGELAHLAPRGSVVVAGPDDAAARAKAAEVERRMREKHAAARGAQ